MTMNPAVVPAGDFPPGVRIHDSTMSTKPTDYVFGALDPVGRLAAVCERLAAVAERLVVVLEKKFGDPPVDPNAARRRGGLTNDTMLVDVLDRPLRDPLLRRLNLAGIHTVGQLTALTRTQLNALGKTTMRMGPGTLDELYDWLAAHRLALAPTPPPGDDRP